MKSLKILAAVVAATVIGIVGTGCGYATASPPDDECTCEDDGNPCTRDVCAAGACEHTAVTPGDPCLAEGGFCDSDGVCRQACQSIPCFDVQVQEGYGCVYTTMPDGSVCHDRTMLGICEAGVCTPPNPPEPVASCENRPNYIKCVLVNNTAPGVCILGSCVRACEEDADCSDTSSCTEETCFWGHCESDKTCV